MRQVGMRVGALAKRIGISVRALHHYDQVGLLSPARRSEAGYRLYSDGDIRRLQQIRSLQQLGLSLEEIRDLLDNRHVAPLTVIDLHLARVRQQVVQAQNLVDRLQQLAGHLHASACIDVEEALQTLEVMQMMEQHYTPEQLETLRGRAQELGAERIHTVEEVEWPTLIEQVRAALDSGQDPASPPVQQLAQRWMALVREFSGGDPGIERASMGFLREMHDSGDPRIDPRMSEYMAYIGKAMASNRGQK
jgi:DNA-binding transcriptional MerR regulator